ncbi:AraC-like DNA-binding protein [Barrientosiimonas humi]|uniref:AraC-like DNA-binding protein n=1 Tax=Barrientosiimonas humi TaxID=999931 RepID=A0A542XDE0_9MICO|nr:helix-turn-helix transcriptional regulator [Barrientosiimonas humi]TQL33837.1 AraC-like DNA-binding protein [Barrientosiimonas humi]CAG7573825.1 Multiple antibiotic resistance protein MarA [Barrientosiimonas humi]
MDHVDRAHLRDPDDDTFTMSRYAVADDLSDLARRFWIPTWVVPPGREAPQRVLQYPVCLVVVSNTYARLYGVTPGLGGTTLVGRGWAVGVMLQPAAGALLATGPVPDLNDRHVPLQGVDGFDDDLVEAVRAAMEPDPTSAGCHARARTLLEEALRTRLPVDDEGLLVNEIVAAVEDDPQILRVHQVCDRFGLSERALQRLTRRRIGLSPKWLIRRRRLHEASGRLRESGTELADLAADLGYTDQAHLTRDFRSATGLTPGEFAGRFRSVAGPRTADPTG